MEYVTNTNPDTVTHCDHLWVHRAGSGYRANPVEICAKCDTERKIGEKPTEERKFSDLETEVEHSDISASATSDTLPEFECNHRTDGLLPEPDGTLEIIEFDFCPKCGEKL